MLVHIRLGLEDLWGGMMIMARGDYEPREISTIRAVGNSIVVLHCRGRSVSWEDYLYAIVSLEELIEKDTNKLRRVAWKLLNNDPETTESLKCLLR